MASVESPRAGASSGDRPELPLILNLSCDFPDPIEPFKTKAVRGLIELTSDRFDHRVVSLNRVSPSPSDMLKEIFSPRELKVEAQDFEHGIALRYYAPGKGVRHGTKLLQLGEWLAQYISGMPRKPALLVGHKLAIEGIAVRRASELTGIPYALSIQGDSDTQILAVRPDLHKEFKAVLHGASVVFPFAPWAWEKVTARLGRPVTDPIILPCATDLDQPIAPVVGGNGLLSVFHLMNYKRKNVAGMVQALRLLDRKGEAPPLAIIGGGEPHERQRCEALARQAPSLTLEGPKDRSEVQAAMNGASAFVMPSLRESFGLVFVEALFAGAPIIYPKGTSVDGYFDSARFAIPVEARDPRSIAEAMACAVNNEAEMKAALAEWQRSDDMRRFQRDTIAQVFADGLLSACGLDQ